MGAYSPLKITGMSSGLVQERENFLLPDDAYPVLVNAYVWRERLLRKKGVQLLGRLRRAIGTTNGAGNVVINITPTPIRSARSTFLIGTNVFQDQGSASPVTMRTNGPGSAILNRNTGVLTITGSTPNTTVWYYPGLPVMGIRLKEQSDTSNNETVFFDQNYAYVYDSSTNNFKEFISGTTWNASGKDVNSVDFFWSTNWWVSQTNIPGTANPLFTTTNIKLFWVTNNTGFSAGNSDPIRITDGTTWVPFFPSVWSQINATDYLVNCLAMLPFRGRLLMFNTWEGVSAAQALNYSNRIRWSTIGNPFIPYSNVSPATGSWRDNIRGQGGFLDIPTSEDIISVGFVRDNLVIYCERSTWQLRYTGRSIAPFQIEKVNSELGCESTFSAVQFDTSLVGIGDKGIVECDSYKSERIDIKIPDFVFGFSTSNSGTSRVHGIRDFITRLAYWTVPLNEYYDPNVSSSSQIFPNVRLLYNYENDSWATFTDTLTTLGTFQILQSRNWLNTPLPWRKLNFPWINKEGGDPEIVGGNHQGFIEYLNKTTNNDVSLIVSDITRASPNPTIITSPNHNLTTGTIISISGIQAGQPFSTSLPNPTTGLISGITQANPAQVNSINHRLATGDRININSVVGMVEVNSREYTITRIDVDNFTLDNVDSTLYTPYISGGVWANLANNVFSIVLLPGDEANKFQLYQYDNVTKEFSTPLVNTPGSSYQGGALMSVVENFNITSKKFNFLDEGQSIQMGYLDILMSSPGVENVSAISLNVYLDYNDVEASNIAPNNDINDNSLNPTPDTFFNSVINTTPASYNNIGGTKFWQRVYCATRASFLTIEYTFSNAQMAGFEQQQDVQIDAQILWIRKAGRIGQ